MQHISWTQPKKPHSLSLNKICYMYTVPLNKFRNYANYVHGFKRIMNIASNSCLVKWLHIKMASWLSWFTSRLHCHILSKDRINVKLFRRSLKMAQASTHDQKMATSSTSKFSWIEFLPVFNFTNKLSNFVQFCQEYFFIIGGLEAQCNLLTLVGRPIMIQCRSKVVQRLS